MGNSSDIVSGVQGQRASSDADAQNTTPHTQRSRSRFEPNAPLNHTPPLVAIEAPVPEASVTTLASVEDVFVLLRQDCDYADARRIPQTSNDTDNSEQHYQPELSQTQTLGVFDSRVNALAALEAVVRLNNEKRSPTGMFTLPGGGTGHMIFHMPTGWRDITYVKFWITRATANTLRVNGEA